MTTCALVGATYFNEADFMRRYRAGEFDCIIAVDGGFAPLEAAGVVPDMAVGDFDSLGYVPRAKRVSRYPEHKDQSDMELAMEKAVNFRHDTLFIYGGIGGRLDHTLANLQLFASFSERGAYVTAICRRVRHPPYHRPRRFHHPRGHRPRHRVRFRGERPGRGRHRTRPGVLA